MPVGPAPDRGRAGTRFKLFPQSPFIDPSKRPETVWVSPPAGSVGAGPADRRMHVIDPVGKRWPYGLNAGPYGSPFLYFPPWTGPLHPPAMPDEAGHFDHLEVGTPEFEMAHVYGCIRRVLDVWEGYFGRPVEWHFAPDHDRLEIALLRHFDNAHVGYGFMEVGAHVSDTGPTAPFSVNFDVLAHEVGHLLVYAEVGLPVAATAAGEYYGFHESAADVVALLAALHFDSVADHLLERTAGNLYTFNELNRFGEVSESEQIRVASNDVKLARFAAGWTDEHDLSEPLTGAIFDILVDLFHDGLVAERLIDPRVGDLLDRIERHPEYGDVAQPVFDEAYERDPRAFKQVLVAARDHLGLLLADAWRLLSPHHLDYGDVAAALIEVDRERTGGRHRRLILDNARWRGIGAVTVGPRLTPPDGTSHALSSRTMTPGDRPYAPRMSYDERWRIARQLGA